MDNLDDLSVLVTLDTGDCWLDGCWEGGCDRKGGCGISWGGLLLGSSCWGVQTGCETEALVVLDEGLLGVPTKSLIFAVPERI